jgi:hypothetical protein
MTHANYVLFISFHQTAVLVYDGYVTGVAFKRLPISCHH